MTEPRSAILVPLTHYEWARSYCPPDPTDAPYAARVIADMVGPLGCTLRADYAALVIEGPTKTLDWITTQGTEAGLGELFPTIYALVRQLQCLSSDVLH